MTPELKTVTNMHKLRLIIVLFLFLTIFSCKEEDTRTKLAQVHDKVLYLEDISDIIPNDITEEDSIMIIRNKTDLWVRKQSILKRAELNLSEEQKDIEEIVEDYKASLLIEKYKQAYLKQEIDTIIRQSEIDNYHKSYPESFILNEEIVKPLFFKFKSNSKKISEFRSYFNSDDEDAIDEMITIANEFAEKTEDFKNKWIFISVLNDLLPKEITHAESFLKLSNKLETRDKNFYYFVIFRNYKLKGETMPLELAEERIKIILLNRRKTNLLNELEKKIYQSDVKNGNIKIFID